MGGTDEHRTVSLQAVVNFKHAELFETQLFGESCIELSDERVSRVKLTQRLLNLGLVLGWDCLTRVMLAFFVRNAWVYSMLVVVEVYGFGVYVR